MFFLNQPISITAIASISSLGNSLERAWEGYRKKAHFLKRKEIGSCQEWVSELPEDVKAEIALLRTYDSKYKDLDASVLYAIYVSRKAIEKAGWSSKDDFGVNIGSSRGATALFEKYHREFLDRGKTGTLASPTTTLGNIASWVAHDLRTKGPEISHSITCSTALHALLNGIAWLQGGMAKKFLVGGSEAPLTAFTIAQMKALHVCSKAAKDEKYPCKALDLEKSKNTMVLGEGASAVCLEKGIPKSALAVIQGVGYATEPLAHNVSISSDAKCFQRSMKMALGNTDADKIDVIVMHAPGTIKGDMTEKRAIEKIFCNKTPFLTTNKWKIGHTFGASGLLSVELAILMLQHQQVIQTPYITYGAMPKTIEKVLVNAVGFGGNAVSVLLSKVG